ncbi:MAG: prepilin-type N-terminal cleavage/methylation domain-containing protein [Gemmatimonadota bacterium]
MTRLEQIVHGVPLRTTSRLLRLRSEGDEAGFTIVELLISIIITSLVTASVMSLLVGQGTLYRNTNDALYTQQTVRAVSDLMTAELRMAAATDIVAAEADSVSIRFDLNRGVVCDGSGGADEATIFWYDSVPNASITGGTAGLAYSDPYEADYQYSDGFAGTVTSTGAVPKAVCTAVGVSAAAPDANYLTMTGWSGNFAGDVPDRGSLIRSYGRLTYHLDPSVFTTGTALWRGVQELVAPLRTTSFSYLMNDASVLTSVPAGSLADIDAIRITGVAEGDDVGLTGASRSFSLEIPLRN